MFIKREINFKHAKCKVILIEIRSVSLLQMKLVEGSN